MHTVRCDTVIFRMAAPRTAIPLPALIVTSAGVWLTFGLVQLAQSYVRARALGANWQLMTAIVGGMPWWVSWFVLTPLLAYVASMFPVPRVGLAARTSARHLRDTAVPVLAAVAITCVQLVATGAVHWFTTSSRVGPATSLPNQIQRFFGNFFLESICTTAAVIGVLVAIDYARAVRDERVTRAKLEADAAALEASVTKAQLAALAMELNPHFLFNTLTAISGLIAQDRAAEAREVIRRLSELLRRTLEAGAHPVTTVAREVELLEDYLYIQRVRFSDRLHVVLDVDPDATTCAIPPMLLQPLVENAVRHGVELAEGPGEVSVHIARTNGALRIAIADSGAGFTNGTPAREGVGIANTRARLDRLYRSNATLELRNGAAGGGQAIITIPADEL